MAHDPVRDEAERLVAAAITALSFAARGIPRGGARPFATGSPECCVCPICRLIASMRDPNADLAERLAAGAGDLASGVTSLLRAFGRTASPGHPEDSDFPESTGEGEQFWESLRQRAREAAATPTSPVDGAAPARPGDPWRSATTAATPAPPMAKKAVKKAAKKAAPAAAEPPTRDATPRPAAKKVAKAAKKAATKAVKKPTGDV